MFICSLKQTRRTSSFHLQTKPTFSVYSMKYMSRQVVNLIPSLYMLFIPLYGYFFATSYSMFWTSLVYILDGTVCWSCDVSPSTKYQWYSSLPNLQPAQPPPNLHPTSPLPLAYILFQILFSIGSTSFWTVSVEPRYSMLVLNIQCYEELCKVGDRREV